MLAASLDAGLEGVVAKQLDSPYEPGRRSACWLKVKNVRREDVVVGGWVPGDRQAHGPHRRAARRRRARTATLRFAGRVGTGFTEAELDRLLEACSSAATDSPFADSGDGPKPPRESVFVEPTRVAEVEFTEWTSDGVMRHPSYKGLREEAPRSAFLDAGKPVRDGVEVQGRRAHR